MIWINAIQESMIIIIENFVGQQNIHTHKMNDLENHLKNHITTHTDIVLRMSINVRL